MEPCESMDYGTLRVWVCGLWNPEGLGLWTMDYGTLKVWVCGLWNPEGLWTEVEMMSWQIFLKEFTADLPHRSYGDQFFVFSPQNV